MPMNLSTCRCFANKYKRRAKREHSEARIHFRDNELDLAIESEEIAMFLDLLVLKYEKLAKQRSY